MTITYNASNQPLLKLGGLRVCRVCDNDTDKKSSVSVRVRANPRPARVLGALARALQYTADHFFRGRAASPGTANHE
jgi:hypothetical protein